MECIESRKKKFGYYSIGIIGICEILDVKLWLKLFELMLVNGGFQVRYSSWVFNFFFQSKNRFDTFFALE